MDIKEFVLTYEGENGVVANLFDYYDKYIVNLDPSFSRYSFKSTKLVLCFFKDHEDVNPSMGYIWHKSYKGVRVCHCFGCGRTADVVRIHQILAKQYFNKELSEVDAAKEVAELFEIPLEEMTVDNNDYQAKTQARVQKMVALSRRYSKRDFADALRDIRRRSPGKPNLEAITLETIKMTAISKRLV